MNRCRKCNVEVLDNSLICPLCSSVLEHGASQEEDREQAYPDIRSKVRKFNVLYRIYYFMAIIGIVAMAVINYITFSGIFWSVISAGAVVYSLITLKTVIQNNTKHTITIFIQTVACILLVLIIDFAIGYSGWALSFAIPFIVLLLNLAIIVLMIVNRANWPGYILLQIFSLVTSLILLILALTKVSDQLFFSLIAFAASVALFTGTLIIGDKPAKTEIKRRFRV
ncbi:DUF6320 domain-containing protein [Parasporobacterium paucivorans]|uniref:Zinc-ribbon domain-containing protein n=1 Tax=Parasporobacterium paucivorans DSM 15970 TaxID=1122934 RepID=A0A1M6JC45_9FIRM|nr:DUF6320 domain-containing protein [Parasporobacterium paucivorans]SHJ44184.1 hypothetical protein SAMN02745691_01971 [Parasporobacterium paucivorans DSM 15970]